MKKINLDPETFAYAVLNTRKTDETDSEKITKEALTLYLTAFSLAERFNQLESEQFDATKNIDFKQLFMSLQHTGN